MRPTTTPLAPPLEHARCASPLGPLLLSASAQGLCGVWFWDQKHLPAWVDPSLPDSPDHPVLRQAAQQLQAYFAGEPVDFDLPLDLRAGSEFQQAVWHALLDIPRGETTSYGEVGRRIGRADAVRAVGAAVGRNPIGIIVPCHRVLGANGSLTGYAGGLPRKVALLRLEQPSSTFHLS